VQNNFIQATALLAISTASTVSTSAAIAQAPASTPNQGPETAPATETSGAPQGQDPKPQRVVVTAQKQGNQAVEEVPRSVTVIGQELIQDAGLTSIEEAARYVPNMLVTGFSARRLSFPYIRGVGSGQGDTAVTTFVDDVPQLSVSSTNLAFTGLDRIEILRGPSSVLWGRNTIGGAINLISKQPSWQPGGELGFTIGNYGQQRYYVRATGPITEDTLAASVDASYETRDGYTNNTVTGNDIDFRESTFARGQLLWTPTTNDTVRFSIYGEQTRDGGFVLSDINGLRSNPWQVSQDFEGRTQRDILAGSVVWNHSEDDYEFVSITSGQSWDIDESSDFDFTAVDAVRRFTQEEEDYGYQELRLSSAPDADLDRGRKDGVKWLVGTSSFYSSSDREAANEFRPNGANIFFPPTSVGTSRASGSFKSWSASVFGQTTWVFANGFEASAALRYDYESREADITNTFTPPGFPAIGGTTSGDRSFERILPRGSIAYRYSEDVKTYLSAARGFKAGGFNLTAPSGFESFGTETSWTYELGAKSQWLDDRLTANAAVFFVDWDDMQLSQFDPTTGGFISNAGESTSHGIELELAGSVSKDLTLFGTAGYLETEFGNATDQNGDVRGNRLPFAPKTTFGAGGQYAKRLPGGHDVFARIDWFHVGEFTYDASGAASERYNLTNLRVGWALDGLRIEGFVNNLLEEEYISIAFDANPSPVASSYVGQNGAPRTFGLSMSLTF